MNIDFTDIKLITEQIGRKPRGALKVLKRCEWGYPQVILNLPVLEDGTPFPTIFWLTCPLLVKRVFRLEEEGFVKKLQLRLKEDSVFELELKRAHEDYRQRRADLMALKDFHNKDAGVGGVSYPGGLKCLHAHYAHYLACGLNPVGKLIDELVGKIAECNECERRIDEVSFD
ncbi:MAG TPA: DUF501 domain-containing protein [Actinobacteria bacterium]|nr:DUF501 domain-containing protein [Actinomycetota bacterium]